MFGHVERMDERGRLKSLRQERGAVSKEMDGGKGMIWCDGVWVVHPGVISVVAIFCSKSSEEGEA